MGPQRTTKACMCSSSPLMRSGRWPGGGPCDVGFGLAVKLPGCCAAPAPRPGPAVHPPQRPNRCPCPALQGSLAEGTFGAWNPVTQEVVVCDVAVGQAELEGSDIEEGQEEEEAGELEAVAVLEEVPAG